MVSNRVEIIGPSRRRRDKGVQSALINQDSKRAAEMEILKLEKVLAQVRQHRKEDDDHLDSQSHSRSQVSPI